MKTRAMMHRIRLAALALGLANAPLAAAQESEASEAKPAREGRNMVLAVSWHGILGRPGPIARNASIRPAERFGRHEFLASWTYGRSRRAIGGVEADLKARDRKGDWLELPEVAMGDETAKRLPRRHASVKSGLDGTKAWQRYLPDGKCRGLLRAAAPASGRAQPVAVRALFAGGIGKELGRKTDQAGLRPDFRGGGRRPGAHALPVGEDGRRRDYRADDRLSGDLSGKAELADLIQAAGPTEFKCAKGVADAAGRG